VLFLVIEMVKEGEFKKRIDLILQETKGDPILRGLVLSQVKHLLEEAKKEIFDTVLDGMVIFEDGVEVNAREVAKKLLKWFGDADV
jgi:hypothetical protein